MKFTCESCSAQYMISDDKVGPNGVKVRCKKCGNVIVVRRGVEAQAAAPEPSPAGAPAGAEGGLDVELGAAFDQAFGDTPPSTPAPAAEKDLAATQAMGAADAAKISAAAAPAQTEWYVAIGQAQVGPLPLAEVKKKWEAGDVGPDSLVWRPGMGDWSPLTTISDLAGYLAPIPRGTARRPSEPAPSARKDHEAPAPTAPVAEPTWKPVGASALAALASEEIAGRGAPVQTTNPRPSPGGVKSLVDELPDGGGVDPTGALPLSIKALEKTDEKKIERRTSVARGAEQVRHRRSASRAIAIVFGLILVGGGAAGAVVLYQRMGSPTMPPAASAPPAAAAPVAEAPPAPSAPTAAASAPEPPPAAAAAPPSAAEKAEAEKPTPSAKPARSAPPPQREARREAPPKREPRVATAEPPRKKGDSLLDFETNDKALNDALSTGTSPSGRSVYVPPAAGGLPDKVSPGDINGAVAQRIDALRRCVSEQKAREPDASGTLKMRWVIQGDGSVRDVRSLTPEYAKGAFAACISGVVKSIRFPRSTTAGQEVIFPFNF